MARAPIAVFAYTRPHHLKRALQGLAANDLAHESPLIIFCDGPKADATEHDRKAIAQVREVAHDVIGFASVEVVEAPANKGLARSVIDGVSLVVKQYGRVIVVEDDAVLSPHFLRFMNDALDRYANDEQVYSVGGWCYYADPVELADTYLIRYPDSLTWAVWERSWNKMEQDGAALYRKLEHADRLKVLDADGRVRYFSRMLKDQVEGRIDSWAIRWTASCVLHGGLSVFPSRSVALNKGFGEGATHETGGDHGEDVQLTDAPIHVERLPVVEDERAIAQWAAYVRYHFEGGSDTSLKGRVWRALPTAVKQWYVRNKHRRPGGPEVLAAPPVSRVFGFDRGKPVDRHYIERFLQAHRHLIKGQVLEVADSTYTKRFAPGAVETWVLLYQGEPGAGTLIGDLAKPDSVPSAAMDTFICTQTLNFIYDVHAAVRGLHQVLKPGGTALVTVAALTQISRYDADRWGDFWRFTPDSARRLFADVFGDDHVEVQVYGNSYAAACLMKGYATEECDGALLDALDPDYPVLIGIKAWRTA